MADAEFEIVNVGLEEAQEWVNEGDTLQGKYVELRTGVGENGSTMYILENESGRKAVWDTSVLNSKLKNCNLLDEVRIKYLGKKKSPKSGREYHDFEVGVRRAS